MKHQLCKAILTCLSAIIFLTPAVAQPFAEEIADFKIKDSISSPPKNAVLFVGSSSFRMWGNIQSDFPGHTIINRGFGGSSLPDLIYYANEIIIPYKPAQIVIYCGENDLSSSDTVSAQLVFERFQSLFNLIRSSLPRVSIVYISMKPSPSRQHLMPKLEEANGLIRNFLRKKRRTGFVDIYSKMLNENGMPVPDLFIKDQLHMNEKGYAIWKKALEPYLK